MNPPMRMLILLAVFWAAGSLLLAAESPSTSATKPAATAKKAEAGTKTDTQEASKDDGKSGDKAGDKDDTKGSSGSGSVKPSIAEQAEAALKAAAEADAGRTSKEPPKGDEQQVQKDAKDDTQLPPSVSAPKGPSPQRFVPTEQVRADFDVSFPIDI